MPEPEKRPFKVVYLKTVSVEGIIDDTDQNLIKVSTDNGKTWSLINKAQVLNAIPLR
jgi:hypothetical protein